jgi:hypothetical protein
MTLSTELIPFGVTSDVVITEVTNNSSSSYATGNSFSITGITSIDTTIKKTDKDYISGYDLLATKIIKQGFDVKFTTKTADLEAMALINGSTLVQTAESNTLSEKSTDIPGTFRMEFATDMVETGDNKDVHVVFYAVTGLISIAPKKDDFWEISFEGKAVLRQDNKKYSDFVSNATATNISVAGSLSLSSNIVKTDAGGTVGGTLSGTTFISEVAAETLSNYTFSYGTTGLTVASITYINANTVAFTCTGTATAGTLSITPKATVTANGIVAVAGTFVIAA